MSNERGEKQLDSYCTKPVKRGWAKRGRRGTGRPAMVERLPGRKKEEGFGEKQLREEGASEMAGEDNKGSARGSSEKIQGG